MCIWLLTRKTKLERRYHSKKIKDSYSQALPSDVHTALKKWALVIQEKMASLLDFNPRKEKKEKKNYASSKKLLISIKAHETYFLVRTSTPSHSNSLVSQCTIPSIRNRP